MTGLEDGLVCLGKALALGQVAPGVIHELNNPLFAVLGLLEFLLADAEPGTKAHQRLSLIQHSALEIKEIVGAVLEFARERADEQSELDLADVAGSAIELFRRTSVARDIDTTLDGARGHALVVASRNGLKQVLLALLTNAEQAMPRGGAITIDIERDGVWSVATVTDTGEGIDPSAAPRIFEPFFTTRASSGACGVGLTIARAIARGYGGDLTLARTGPGGSGFVLRLPAG